MDTQTASREKQSPLMEIHFKFQDKRKDAIEIFNRLQTIANKLSDESGNVSEKKPEPKVGEQRPPGIMRDLESDADEIDDVLNKIDKQIKKIESII